MYKDIGCIIMASGHGRRFGGNKLIYKINNKEIISYVLDAVPSDLRKNAYIVTRYEEVAELAKERNIKALIHSLPVQSDTVKVGLSHVQPGLKGCIFISGDQPFIQTETIEKLIQLFYANNCSRICRLGFNGKQGAPVIFPAYCFPELMALTGDTGGRSVIKHHLQDVVILQATNEKELLDIDKPEDLEQCLVSGNTEK